MPGCATSGIIGSMPNELSKSSKHITRSSNVRVRVGIGGWTYAPWRGTFYPDDLVQRLELEYASRQLTSIEINGTFHRQQSVATYTKWREQTPPGFIFSVKAPGRITSARVLANSGGAIESFLDGIVALGDRLGPILWQFGPSKPFDREDFVAFLDLLPTKIGTRVLRHVLDVRHPTFACADYIALARAHRFPTVCTDSPEFGCIADITGDFTYARLMRTQSQVATGYPAIELDAWLARIQRWANGHDNSDLPHVAAPMPDSKPRDVFVYFISGAKQRAPAAAQAMLQRLASAAIG